MGTRTATWEEPSRLMEGAHGKTGLTYLRDIIDGRLPQAPISATLDFAIVDAAEGRARFRGNPDESQYNPMGTVHGGWVTTLLDSAMGSAVMSVLDEKTGYSTAQINVHLIKAITRATGPVEAEGRIVSRGGRLAVGEGWLTDGKGTVLAHATCTCAILPRG